MTEETRPTAQRAPGGAQPGSEAVGMPLALKIGVAAAVGFAAIASGLFLSRRGRHLVREAMEGRRRTRLEDRVLDALWGDRSLGRLDLDVKEIEGGIIEVYGDVASADEARRACLLAERVSGVKGVLDRLTVAAGGSSTRSSRWKFHGRRGGPSRVP
jgi:hypothetical protein